MPEHSINAANEQNKYFPYAGLFHLQRQSFYTAGQDSFTKPPAQNSDLFMSLNNIEQLQGILQRRRGYQLFSNQSPSTPFTRMYSYRNEITSVRRAVATSTAQVLVTDETGNLIVSNLFTPASTNQAPRMVTSRSYAYFADGNSADYLKYDGTQNPSNTTGLTNWGIDINQTNASTVFGPNNPGTVADQGFNGGSANSSAGPNAVGQGVDSGSGGTQVWSNPNNITTNSLAAIALGQSSISTLSNYLNASHFGFNLPATTTSINGIQVAITRQGLSGSGRSTTDNGVFLLNASSSQVGSDHSQGGSWSTSSTIVNYGNSTDTWGAGLTRTDINSVNFGAALRVRLAASSSTSEAFVFYVQITVWYTYSLGVSTSWSPTNSLASSATAQTSISSQMRCTNYSLAPTGTILGIKAIINATATAGTSPALSIQLVKAGTPSYSVKSTNITSSSATNYTFGSSNDIWNGVWSSSDINGVTTFGCQFAVQTSSGTSTVTVNSAQITVYTLTAPITLGAPAGGAITLQSGRTYFCVFQNTTAGHASALNSPSASTGALTAQQQPLSTIPVSTDPQVDFKLILATADGNDTSKLFLLATLPNATTTYTDNIPDTTLINNAVYQETQQDGTLHGVANNNPTKSPGVIGYQNGILFPTKHKGRIYGAIGNTVFFSKNLADVTTSTGTVTSKWEESWPLTNQLDLSETAETVQGVYSDGETLWVATERAIRRLVGDSPTNFQLPEIQFNECGLLNQEVWRVVFLEDQPVGTMWLTPDFKVMASDFNTYQDVGTPIQDVLNTINPVAAQTCHASFATLGPAYYYMLYIPTGTATTPSTVCIYNLATKTWHIWAPTDNPTASVFFFDATGAPRWLFAANAGPLYEWKVNLVQDRVNNTPVYYSVTAQTSWLDFGDSGLRKALNQIIVATQDTALTITLEAAILDSDLDISPIQALAATTVSTGPLGDLFVPLAAVGTGHRWYRFTFTSPASSVVDVLDYYNVEALPVLRL